MKFIVLGCPRSGTSMITKILVNSGMNIIEEDLMKPNIHYNPDGYYENINIVKINDQLIRLKHKNNKFNFLNIPFNEEIEESIEYIFKEIITFFLWELTK